MNIWAEKFDSKVSHATENQLLKVLYKMQTGFKLDNSKSIDAIVESRALIFIVLI